MRLTVLEAYELCALLWRYLQKNTDKDKESYPGFAESGEIPDHYCYFCEYAGKKHNSFRANCIICPGLELWKQGEYEYGPNNHDFIEDDYPCEYFSESPYKNWVEGTYEERSLNAGKIADFCDEKIKEIKDFEKWDTEKQVPYSSE